MATKKYLGTTGLEHLWDKVEAALPSKTSDLTNDSGFITQDAVPTKTSDLTNDSGFITLADLPVYDGSVS